MANTGPTLVTGAAGFAGSHLLDHLLANGVECVGWYRPRSAHQQVQGVRWQAVDLLDRQAIDTALTEIRPSRVFHCAGAAAVGSAWAEVSSTLADNVLGTHHLLEGLRDIAPDARLLITSSGLVYEPSDQPRSETSPLRPVGPYAVSKLAQELVGAGSPGGPEVWIARPFNHIGPRQSDAFVASSFARQIAEIEAGVRPPRVAVGNLEARRDLSDVRDTVRAYHLILESGIAGRPYNVCSERAVTIQSLLDTLRRKSRVAIEVVRDPARYRPVDTPVVLGDATRLREELGWRCEVPLEQTLDDLLAYWRQHLSNASRI